MIRAGDLDERITLQRMAAPEDPWATPETTWTDLATVWAAVTWVSDRERFAAGETRAEITHRFTLRRAAAWADLGPLDRIAYEGRIHDILGVKRLGRDGLEVTAKARAE